MAIVKRGITFLKDFDLFKLNIQVLSKVFELFSSNVHLLILVIPFSQLKEIF